MQRPVAGVVGAWQARLRGEEERWGHRAAAAACARRPRGRRPPRSCWPLRPRRRSSAGSTSGWWSRRSGSPTRAPSGAAPTARGRGRSGCSTAAAPSRSGPSSWWVAWGAQLKKELLSCGRALGWLMPSAYSVWGVILVGRKGEAVATARRGRWQTPCWPARPPRRRGTRATSLPTLSSTSRWGSTAACSAALPVPGCGILLLVDVGMICKLAKLWEFRLAGWTGDVATFQNSAPTQGWLRVWCLIFGCLEEILRHIVDNTVWLIVWIPLSWHHLLVCGKNCLTVLCQLRHTMLGPACSSCYSMMCSILVCKHGLWWINSL